MACACPTNNRSRATRVRAHVRRTVTGATGVSAHSRNRARKSVVKRDAHPNTVKSPGGRVFTIDQKKDPHSGDVTMYPIRLDGQQVGSLWPTESYGLTPAGRMRWSASLRELVWSGDMPPTGLGFDVAGLDTPGEALAKIIRNADDVLNWREGKAVRSIYAGGRAHRESGQKEGAFQRSRNRAYSTRYDVEKNKTPGYYTAYRYEGEKLVLQSASIRADSAKEARMKIKENRVVWFEPHR